MGTKTDDEAATGATEVKPADSAEEQAAPAGTEPTGPAEPTGTETVAEGDDEEFDEEAPAAGESPSGVGQGAGAVVSAALGLVSLTGSWLGTVAAARETLIGQLRTSSTASVSTQVKEIYGDAWHASALYGGLFALLALVVGVVVLARPAFGAPGRVQQAPWIKSVSWAGVALGVIGLILAVLKYTDVLLGLPSAS
ncbi:MULTISPECIES: hypothetical protein [Streptomyces]|uniref:Integral membrane protein n=1 Tax=Streptomyces doudnae TaxID=3075536 RepID=A0ABD5EJP1_9ACTN|nr:MULTISPECIES: hypothetical protein [unclassified Streptomyces]MDT0434846.1 hypothetical protein [Streptomyces sp. DSM 41981]MYQ64273.1 hypothetical protein [Streptomyces sp. SID4950]SCD75422.1 hypothetical protein GA0115242_113519 [Streptomyces sp. SolWspMP-5a-2]